MHFSTYLNLLVTLKKMLINSSFLKLLPCWISKIPCFFLFFKFVILCYLNVGAFLGCTLLPFLWDAWMTSSDPMILIICEIVSIPKITFILCFFLVLINPLSPPFECSIFQIWHIPIWRKYLFSILTTPNPICCYIIIFLKGHFSH